jgi:magnesium transporter
MSHPQIKHSPSTVGEHTIPIPFVFKRDETVQHVLTNLKRHQNSWPNTEFIYVVNSEKVLIGVIPFKKIITASVNTKLETLMHTMFVTLSPHAHQETAAKLAITENLENIPVVDHEGVFMGIVDATEIFKILHEDHIERLMKFSGILNSESFFGHHRESSFHIVFARLPWLLIGLIGGVFSTSIIEYFSSTLQKQIELAYFIPLIVYVNAAVGNQTQTVFIRNTTFEKSGLIKGILSELKVAVLMGSVLSFLIFVYALIRHDNTKLAEIISISMFVGIFSSAVIATLIPWTLEKFKKDPALGSGPIATIIQDVVSVVIYFSVATLLL